ncbi:MAG: hypothetical protein EBS71_09295 [Actinobacteria bacterium]|nr:hypothetical protein [Actinomycetota bacterium]
MSSKSLFAKAGVVVASVALGSVAGSFISVSAAPTSVVVCASKSTGALRYSKAGTCKTTETKLTLGQEGPAGEKGATGATGATGPAGSYSGTVGIRTISTSAATLELADAGKVLVVTVGTDITVPADATVNFPVGTRIEIARTTGSPTLTGAAGVTVNGISAPGAASFDSGTYQQGILIKTAANTWILLKMPDQS